MKFAVWLLPFCNISLAFPLMAFVAPALSLFSAVLEPVRCIIGYHRNLTEKLYGQHIAIERLYYHVKAHMEDPSPRRSLALSLHGFTGVGKNYATSILATNLYKRGEDSQFYHFFDATIHFPDRDAVEKYKLNVLQAIQEGVRACSTSMFVFDEVHKMPAGVIDIIVPLLGYSKSIDGIDFRKAIFIFLGNNGASVINEYLYKTLNDGRRRTSLLYSDVRRILISSVYKEEGALEYSDLIRGHALTAVIPFLPLQETHVRQCIADAAFRLGTQRTDEMEDFILSELDWGPEDTQFFSTSGCKLVYDKMGFFLQHRILLIADDYGGDSRIRGEL